MRSRDAAEHEGVLGSGFEDLKQFLLSKVDLSKFEIKKCAAQRYGNRLFIRDHGKDQSRHRLRIGKHVASKPSGMVEGTIDVVNGSYVEVFGAQFFGKGQDVVPLVFIGKILKPHMASYPVVLRKIKAQNRDHYSRADTKLWGKGKPRYGNRQEPENPRKRA